MKQILAYQAEPGQFRRWFNDTGNKIAEAKAKGYVHVMDSGHPVQRVVDREGAVAFLMEKGLIERFIDRRCYIHRNPALLARLRRLNPTLTMGEIPRGWRRNESLRYLKMLQHVVGKREFMERFMQRRDASRAAARFAWNSIPKDVLLRYGKRVYARAEAIEDKFGVWIGRSLVS